MPSIINLLNAGIVTLALCLTSMSARAEPARATGSWSAQASAAAKPAKTKVRAKLLVVYPRISLRKPDLPKAPALSSNVGKGIKVNTIR